MNSHRDEQYVPCAAFADWAGEPISSAWPEYLANLDQARAVAGPDELRAALQFALRSAAVETGAIEGLYATTRGITRTVAIQGALGEAELEKMGADVRGHFEAQLAAFVVLASRQPACRAVGTVIVGLANQVSNPNSFIVIDANRPTLEPLGLRIAELHPSMSAVSEELIMGWARRFTGAVLSELERCLAGALSRDGIDPAAP